MKNLFKKSNRIDRKIHDLKQMGEYLDKVEGIKRDFLASYMYGQNLNQLK